MKSPRQKKYQAFISYRHGAGSGFAIPLARAIQRYARFFWSPSRKLFRDEEYLKPGADLPEMIRSALEDADFLVLLASPEAAQSKWVWNELSQWCSRPERISNLIIVLTSGSISIDAQKKRIDWATTTALPRSLSNFLTSVPLYVDLSWTQNTSQFDLQHPRFKSAVNAIVAKMEDVDPHTMLGVQADAFRKNRRLGIASFSFITILVLLAGALAWATALANRNLRASLIATLSEGVAARDPTVAFRLAKEAQELKPSFTSAKTIFKLYNSNSLFFSHLFRDVMDADLQPSAERALIVSGVFDTPSTRIIDLMSGSEIVVPNGLQKIVGGRFVGNGQRVLTWSSTGLMSLWELDGRHVADLQTSMDEFAVPSFDRSRNVVVAGSSDRIQIWQLDSLKHFEVDVGDVNLAQAHVTAACSPTRKEFAEYRTGESTARTRGFDGIVKHSMESNGEISGLTYSPNGNLVVILSTRGASVWQNGERVSLIQYEDEITSAEFTADQQFLIISLLNGRAFIHDVSGFRNELKSLGREFTRSARATDVLAPSIVRPRWIAQARRNGVVSIYDMEGTLQYQLIGHQPGNGLNASFIRVSWDDDASTLITVGRDNVARIWSTKTGRFRLVRNTKNVRYELKGFSQKGDMLALEASSSNGHVAEVYGLDGTLVRSLSGHESFIRTVLFSDQGTIVTHSNDRIQIWPTTGSPIVLKPETQKLFTGTLRFSDDGSRIFLEDTLGEKGVQNEWTIAGESLGTRTSESPRKSSDGDKLKLPDVLWLRTELEYGFVVYDQTKSDEVFVRAELGAGYIVSNKTSPLGYVYAKGDSGTEWFLLNANRILELQTHLKLDRLIWNLDAKERMRLGIAGH